MLSKETRLAVLALVVLASMTMVMTIFRGSGSSAEQALPNNTVSIEPAVIGRQVRAAIALGEEATASLSAPGSDDIGTTHTLLDTMYRQVRLALGNLKDRKARNKFPDPVLELEISKITFAWNTIRRPVDGFFNSPAKDEWKANAAQDLRVTMATLRQVEAMLP